MKYKFKVGIMSKRLSKEEWIRKKRFKRKVMITAVGMLFIFITAVSLFIMYHLVMRRFGSNNPGKDDISISLSNGATIQQDYLTPNPYSRPQTPLKRIDGIVIHYTANPGTSAKNNRSYFEGLKTKMTTYASSHFIIGLKGEIVQCIPLTEEAYASNERNDDTISIECCHPDETGEFNEQTYQSLVALTAALCFEYDLKEEDIIRHYDVTGKLCPLYYVEHEDAWEAFKSKVIEEIKILENTTNPEIQ